MTNYITCTKCGEFVEYNAFLLLEGLCPKCFNELNNGVRAEDLIREFYRKQFDEIIKKEGCY